MKKYIIGVLVFVGLFVSFASVQAKTTLSTQQMTVIMSLLNAFDVDQAKIDQVVKILNDGTGCQVGDKYSRTTGIPCAKEEAKTQTQTEVSKPAGSTAPATLQGNKCGNFGCPSA